MVKYLSQSRVKPFAVLLAIWSTLWLADVSRANAQRAFTSNVEIPEITAFITEAGPYGHGGGEGCIHYVVSLRLASLLENRGITQLLSATLLYVDATNPPRDDRVADLAVIILSGVKPAADGWMSERQRAKDMRVIKVPLAVNRAIRLGFPKDGDWAAYFKTIASPYGK
jgi:hypothetical protein